jgi:hypothetical protein
MPPSPCIMVLLICRVKSFPFHDHYARKHRGLSYAMRVCIYNYGIMGSWLCMRDMSSKSGPFQTWRAALSRWHSPAGTEEEFDAISRHTVSRGFWSTIHVNPSGPFRYHSVSCIVKYDGYDISRHKEQVLHRVTEFGPRILRISDPDLHLYLTPVQPYACRT